MKKIWTAAGLVGACAVCCAPLLLPVLAGAGVAGVGAVGGGLVAGLSFDAVACTALALAALACLAIWSYRRRKAAERAACQCETMCSTAAAGPACAGGTASPQA